MKFYNAPLDRATVLPMPEACGLCGQLWGPRKGFQPVKDHCHWCRKFRGWIHQVCNMRLSGYEKKCDDLPGWMAVRAGDPRREYLGRTCYLKCRPPTKYDEENGAQIVIPPNGQPNGTPVVPRRPRRPKRKGRKA